jgi:RND family efflux transporter MFP subunit
MRLMFSLPLLLLALAACSNQGDSPEPAQLVRVFRVGDGPAAAADGDSLTGTVAARIETTLSFREGGRIVQRAVDNGAEVRAGDLIARIDPADLQLASAGARAQAQAARSAVAAARATAERTAADERRLQGLAEAGAISRRDYDAALEGMRAARARLAAAEADANAASANASLQGNRRGYSELRALAGGVVTSVLAEPGQVVAAGTPIVTLAQDGAREIVVEVPEQRRSALPRTATATLYGGGEFSVELRELAAAADPVTRTYRARFRVLGASPPLGATATLHFAGSASAGIVTVPIGALAERGGGPGLWVIGADNKVAWRRVAVAGMDGERAAVRGLRTGERIVALGAHLLQPGQAVRFGPEPASRLAAR